MCHASKFFKILQASKAMVVYCIRYRNGRFRKYVNVYALKEVEFQVNC